jgi:hypothetical protein
MAGRWRGTFTTEGVLECSEHESKRSRGAHGTSGNSVRMGEFAGERANPPVGGQQDACLDRREAKILIQHR